MVELPPVVPSGALGGVVGVLGAEVGEFGVALGVVAGEFGVTSVPGCVVPGVVVVAPGV